MTYGDRPDDGRVLDLDTSWDGVGWLLTAATSPDEPLGEVLLGGDEFGEDGGYGPPRLLSAEDVRRLGVRLAAVDENAVRLSFDPVAMVDVYPGSWDDGRRLEEDLLPALNSVRDFYAAAAAAGDDIVIYLT